MTMARDPGDWLDSALCREVGPEPFFQENKGGSNKAAKRICAACPVTRECLEYALSYGGLSGIYGGTSERERYIMLKQRKAEAA